MVRPVVIAALTIDSTARRSGIPHGWAALILLALTLLLELPGFSSLPPMDRDEPRFAQATKQMLETGDFVAIRFQDEARNKKPVGIYWLQAVTVAAGEALGVPDARRTIWLYRVPSLLGALTAVLATYWTALALTDRRSALVGAALFAGSVILTVESHLAKTDAVLLATNVIAMGALARVYRGARETPAGRPPWGLLLAFWTAIGVGVLIKGPITPMVPAFAAVVLSVNDRNVRWFAALRPALGFAWVLILVLPWFVLILFRTHGAFLADSVGHDMLGKVAGSQESHGAPPGTYLVAFWLTAWPMAPFAALAVADAWRRRRETSVSFLLAWIVPTWILFEIVPTKLPHYVMPVYPAVAILTAHLLASETRPGTRPRWVAALVFSLLAVLPVVVAGALVGGTGLLWTQLPWAAYVSGGAVVILAFICAGLAARRLQVGAFPAAAMLALVAAAAINLFVLGYLLRPSVSDLLAVSGHAARAERTWAEQSGCGDRLRVATAGDHEPSLVFLTGTDLLLTTPEGAADFLKNGACRAALIESRGEAAFRAALGDAAEMHLAARVPGTAINGSKHLDIALYVRQRSPQ
jgi:4-amino-4-deoxy-L-arabinose transferase-like glycosyltransferase